MSVSELVVADVQVFSLEIGDAGHPHVYFVFFVLVHVEGHFGGSNEFGGVYVSDGEVFVLAGGMDGVIVHLLYKWMLVTFVMKSITLLEWF